MEEFYIDNSLVSSHKTSINKIHFLNLDSNDNQIVMELQKSMRELVVLVKYNAQNKNNHIWCNHLELFINYDVLRKISTIYRS